MIVFWFRSLIMVLNVWSLMVSLLYDLIGGVLEFISVFFKVSCSWCFVGLVDRIWVLIFIFFLNFFLGCCRWILERCILGIRLEIFLVIFMIKLLSLCLLMINFLIIFGIIIFMGMFCIFKNGCFKIFFFIDRLYMLLKGL